MKKNANSVTDVHTSHYRRRSHTAALRTARTPGHNIWTTTAEGGAQCPSNNEDPFACMIWCKDRILYFFKILVVSKEYFPSLITATNLSTDQFFFFIFVFKHPLISMLPILTLTFSKHQRKTQKQTKKPHHRIIKGSLG